MRIAFILAMLLFFGLFARPLWAGGGQNVTVKDRPNDGGGALIVSWKPSTLKDIVKYEITRVSQNGERVVVGEKDREDTSFTDEGFDEAPLKNGVFYAYIVSAVGPDGVSTDSALTEFACSEASWFHTGRLANLLSVLTFIGLFFGIVLRGSKGKDLYIRPISALDALDDAIGRAAEMGRPLLYVPGLGDIAHPSTVASMGILSKVGEKAVRLWTKVKVPNYSPLVWPVAQNVLKQAYIKAGRPDEYTADDVPYFTSRFLTFATAVAGIMTREKTATNLLIGHFYSEALILAETGASTGAVQIGGTDSEAQIPFFITTCDHTMIGEELFAAAALVSDDGVSKSSIKAADWFKLLIIVSICIGVIFSVFAATGSEASADILRQMVGFLKGEF